MKRKESEVIEFKNIVTEKIKKEVVAFANTNGGEIYVGIDDDGSIIGLDNMDEEKTRFTNIIRDSIRPDVTLFTDTSEITEEEKEILQIRISRGTRRPYYLAQKGLRPEGVYIRQGNSSVPATEEQIRIMIKESDGDNLEEMRSLNQDLTFEYASAFFQNSHVLLGESQMRTLKMVDADGMYTNLGLILSDQNPYSVKAAVFQGTDQSLFKDRKEFEGSLLKQFDDIMEFLNLLNPLQGTFENYRRVDQYGYPKDALREAVLNALVHRDYSIPDSSLLSVFDNRIDIVSIGGLVKGMEMKDLMIPVSICRNRNLAAVFYRLHLIEQYGTGISRIMAAYSPSARKPIFESSGVSFRVTLPNINVSDIPSDQQKKPKLSFSKEETRLLQNIPAERGISRKEAEILLSLSKAQTIRLLHSLIDKKAIILEGTGKNTRYFLADSDGEKQKQSGEVS